MIPPAMAGFLFDERTRAAYRVRAPLWEAKEANMWFIRSVSHLRVSTLLLMGLVVLLEYKASIHNPFWPKLFGRTDEAALDLWSGQHLMNGVLFAALYALLLRRGEKPTPSEFCWFVLLCSTVWELIESGTDLGWGGERVANWMTGVEHWSNRLVADPLIVVLGSNIYQRVPRIIYPVVLGTIVWLCANLLAPDCMYLQECLMAHLP